MQFIFMSVFELTAPLHLNLDLILIHFHVFCIKPRHNKNNIKPIKLCPSPPVDVECDADGKRLLR